MNGTLLIGVLLVFGLAGIMVYAVGLYNTLVRLSNNIDKAWSNIDVILKQRHDELPKLVKVCNSYMTHERETMERVTSARSVYSLSTSVDEKEGGKSAHQSSRQTVRRRRTVSGFESKPGLSQSTAADCRTGKHDRRPARVL